MHQAEKKKPPTFKRYKSLLDHPLVKPWLGGYKIGTHYIYLNGLDEFLKWRKITVEQILAERKADMRKADEVERYHYERLAIEFFRHLKEKGAGGVKCQNALKALRSFFDYHYLPLKFRHAEVAEFSKGLKPVYIDYIPTREDLKTMYEAGDARDHAIILTLASTGISGDICELTRQQFEQGIARMAGPNDPICLAPRGDYLYRKKTGVRMRPFLTSDAIHAIKIYLKARKDNAPWLFVDRTGEKMTSGAVNKIVLRLAKRALLDIPAGQRIRMHNFRDFFEEACRANDVAENWIYVMDGRKIAGSSDFYTHANEDKLLEKFKKVEPHLSISRLSNMVLLRKKHEIALDDTERVALDGMKRLVGEERFRRWAEYELTKMPKAMIPWNPDEDYEPAIYRRHRILEEMLGKKKRAAKRD